MKWTMAVLVALAISAPAAFAGEISDQAAEAEKLLQAGDGAGALAKFNGAEEALWKAMPLGVMNVRQVDSATGFGIYSERANHVYKPGEQVALYMEPVGYGYGSDGLGNSSIALSVDLTVLSESGENSAPSKRSAASRSPHARTTANCSSNSTFPLMACRPANTAATSSCMTRTQARRRLSPPTSRSPANRSKP
ncbi:hypothetical protein [Mesorhizobium sp. INR15]|uniref:hypothetical protein n=1 Tax=Mesorhizobium sp. INR15 TaxID=2654248 RepID=UPI00215664DE|nr:hypothetical protein [Mesorhizobium sp. INR15]